MRSLVSPILILSLAAAAKGQDAKDNPAERLRAMRAIDRIELTTEDPPDQALLDYLVKRAKTF